MGRLHKSESDLSKHGQVFQSFVKLYYNIEEDTKYTFRTQRILETEQSCTISTQLKKLKVLNSLRNPYVVPQQSFPPRKPVILKFKDTDWFRLFFALCLKLHL